MKIRSRPFALRQDTAAPMVLFGARLKLSVTDGNWPWWLIASGAVEGLTVANWLSGTMPPPLDFTHKNSG